MTIVSPPSVKSDPWISVPDANPQAQLRLFCFPYAGGGTAAYYPWAKHLPREVGLCSIRLPGRESRLREAPYVRMAPLVRELASALAPYFDRPFVFFGHSMGALLAFELARHLRRAQMAEPVHLVASAHRAPQLPDPEPPLYQLSDDELIREMDKRYNGIPQVIRESPELLALFLPTMRADVAVLDTYTYADEPPLACPITVFGGDRDPSVTTAELSAWRTQTQGAFRLREFAGDHFFIHVAQPVVLQALGEELRPYLAGSSRYA